MDRIVTLIFFFFGLCGPHCHALRQFHYVNEKMTWFKAQSYCREKYTDLATLESSEHISRLNRPALATGNSWFGLSDLATSWKGTLGNDSNSWRWSARNDMNKDGYQNWSPGEPNNSPIEYCVVMGGYGKWNDLSCEQLKSFICYDGTPENEKIYVLVSLLKTWANARHYCRQHYTELAMIENSADNSKVDSVRANSEVWIGLYRVPWSWSDKTNSLFRNWVVGEPNNYGGSQMCAAESSVHLWDDVNCNYEFAFICHEDPIVQRNVVKIKIQTDADLTDTAVNTQVLQQIDPVLKEHLGLSHINLQWKIQPRKQETEKLTSTQCTSHV